MSTYSDNFQRANENPLASPWTWYGGNFQLSGDLVQPQYGGSTGYGGAYMYNGPVLYDQYSQVTIKNVVSNGSFVGPAVRMFNFNGGAAWYQFHTGGPLGSQGYVYLEKYLSTGGSYITYGLATVNAGDVLKLTAVGNVLTCYVNGTQVLQGTDSALTKGWIGMAAYATNLATDAQISAWQGGDLGTPTWGNLTFVPAPLSPTSSGVPGQTAYDSTYLYVCTSPNSWSRSPLSSL